MKVGDEVYLREDSEWNDGSENNPISTKGRIIDIDGHENLPISVVWGFGGNSYKSLDLILASEHGIPAMNQGHPNAAILMEIAKEAAVNPEYWKEFEHTTIGISWGEINSESCLLSCIINDVKLRRRPRTIRIGNYDVPKYCKAWVNKSILEGGFIACFNFDKEEFAELMLKALQELLGKK